MKFKLKSIKGTPQLHWRVITSHHPRGKVRHLQAIYTHKTILSQPYPMSLEEYGVDGLF